MCMQEPRMCAVRMPVSCSFNFIIIYWFYFIIIIIINVYVIIISFCPKITPDAKSHVHHCQSNFIEKQRLQFALVHSLKSSKGHTRNALRIFCRYPLAQQFRDAAMEKCVDFGSSITCTIVSFSCCQILSRSICRETKKYSLLSRSIV